MAAQEGSEASVTSTSSNPNWWDIHTNPLSSWNHMAAPWQHHHNPAQASCEEDVPTSAAASFATATPAQSGLSADGGSPVDNHLWSHLLLGIGSAAADDGQRKFLEALSSKNLAAAGILEPACDYLKKLDGGSWEFPNSSAIFAGKRTDVLGNWSIAPPQRELEALRIETPDASSSSSYLGGPGLLSPCYDRQLGGDGDGVAYPYGGVVAVQEAASWSGNATRNFSDLISFGSSMNKATMVSNRLHARGLDVVQARKQLGHEASSLPARRNVKGFGNAGEGKNKRSEDTPENVLCKKSKNETSKLQLPKVKLADKITALQQIVAPFGKTDTASVLLEAINYIRFLHEQVQLLSDPYMKSGVNKDHTSWGGMERQEATERKADLSSRGLCLVPVSCTPQVYRENTGPDYWTPTYRGCLYR